MVGSFGVEVHVVAEESGLVERLDEFVALQVDVGEVEMSRDELCTDFDEVPESVRGDGSVARALGVEAVFPVHDGVAGVGFESARERTTEG